MLEIVEAQQNDPHVQTLSHDDELTTQVVENTQVLCKRQRHGPSYCFPELSNKLVPPLPPTPRHNPTRGHIPCCNVLERYVQYHPQIYQIYQKLL